MHLKYLVSECVRGSTTGHLFNPKIVFNRKLKNTFELPLIELESSYSQSRHRQLQQIENLFIFIITYSLTLRLIYDNHIILKLNLNMNDKFYSFITIELFILFMKYSKLALLYRKSTRGINN